MRFFLKKSARVMPLNSHKLRLALDARKPMWSSCISVISSAGYAAQKAISGQNIQSIPKQATHIFEVKGKRGSLFRFGVQPEPEKLQVQSLSGHLLTVPYLESEFPLRSWTVERFLDQVISEVTVDSRIHGLYINDTKTLIFGIHLGNINLHYSGFLYINDNGELAIKDVETKANAGNKHELCAFMGASANQKELVLSGLRAHHYSLQKNEPRKSLVIKAKVPKKKKPVHP